MSEKHCETFWATIYIAGDYAHAKQICREHCRQQGLCVTVTPTTYIYTGGEESGVAVRLINYPRFEAAPLEILRQAEHLAGVLRAQLSQWSYLIETPTETYWQSDKPENQS